jgi:ABC-type nitrate/sulfonate/bicarbonate transport system permease component
MRKFGSIENKIIPITFFAILILIWQFIGGNNSTLTYSILPTPVDIFKTLTQIFPNIQVHLFATLYEAFVGFTISILLSVVLAVLMDSVKLIKKAAYPLLVVSQTIPIIVLAPLFTMWFGYLYLPKIIVVVLVCFFPIMISLLDGLNSVDVDILNLMRSMGATKVRIFIYAKFPASMVNFFSGLRIAATYSIMGAVIGEWLGGEKGLGVYMVRVRHSFEYDKVFAVSIIIIALSMILFGLVTLIQNYSMPWYRMNNEDFRRTKK